jgi:hypothetical protein
MFGADTVQNELGTQKPVTVTFSAQTYTVHGVTDVSDFPILRGYRPVPDR